MGGVAVTAPAQPKLVVVSPLADLAGGETAVLRLLPELQDRGWSVRLTVPAPGRLRDAAEELGLATLWLPLGPPERRTPASYLGGIFAARLARADVVLLNGLPAQRTVPALRAVRVPAVVRVNNPLPERPPAWDRRIFWEVVRGIAADSDHTAGECIAAGADEEVVRRAYPASWQGPDQPPPAALTGSRIGFVGWLEPRKGVDVLLRAAPSILEGRPDATIEVVGQAHATAPADYEPELRRTVASAGLEDRVTFAGWRPGGEAIHSFDVLAVPSLAEPFGTVAAEAAASGVPVVASDVGGLAEVVVDGETGLLTPAGDPEALGNAIGRLLDDRELLGRLGAAAHSRASRFSPAAYADAMELMLRRAAELGVGDRG